MERSAIHIRPVEPADLDVVAETDGRVVGFLFGWVAESEFGIPGRVGQNTGNQDHRQEGHRGDPGRPPDPLRGHRHYLAAQGRYAHLDAAGVAAVQADVDRRWAALLDRCASRTDPTAAVPAVAAGASGP